MDSAHTVKQTNITHSSRNYFLCGYCGTGCTHGSYCGCAASREEVRGAPTPEVDIDSIELELP